MFMATWLPFRRIVYSVLLLAMMVFIIQLIIDLNTPTAPARVPELFVYVWEAG